MKQAENLGTLLEPFNSSTKQTSINMDIPLIFLQLLNRKNQDVIVLWNSLKQQHISTPWSFSDKGKRQK